MKYSIHLFLLLTCITLTSCTKKQIESPYIKALHPTNFLSDTLDSSSTEFNGIYYLYKTCQYSNDDKQHCKEDTVNTWETKKIDGNFVVRLNNLKDEYFLVLQQDKSYATFTIDLIEDIVAGWYIIDKIQTTPSGFTLHRSDMVQTYGYRLDEKPIPNPKNFYQPDYLVRVDELMPSLQIHEPQEVLDFRKFGNEYFIDCNNYEKTNPKVISSTIKSSCLYIETDLLWFKNIK